MVGPIPPFAQIADFLPESERRALLGWTIANPGEFAAATVGRVNEVDPAKRICAVTRHLGSLEPALRDRFLTAVPTLTRLTGTSLRPDSLEFEIAAHGNGAFFKPHTDVFVGAGTTESTEETRSRRMLSAVYYFHDEPRAFFGGRLRLYRFGSAADGKSINGEEDFIELDPVGNTLIAFPSTVLHEVSPVQCPSDRFEDRRFALNCWYRQVA